MKRTSDIKKKFESANIKLSRQNKIYIFGETFGKIIFKSKRIIKLNLALWLPPTEEYLYSVICL